MDYGLELYNEFGEAVIAEGTTLWVKDTGLTVRGAPNASNGGIMIGDRFFIEPDLLDYGRSAFTEAGSFGFVGECHNYAAGNVFRTNFAGTSNNRAYLSDCGAYDADDLFFFEIPPTGIVQAMTFQLSHPNLASSYGLSDLKMAYIVPRFDGNAPYTGPVCWCLASRSGNNGALSPDTYGLQKFAADGRLIYDSRGDNIVILDHLVVSEAQIADVLDNNAVIDLPLRTPVPGAIANLSNFFNADLGSATGTYPVLTQTDANTLRLARVKNDHSFNNIDVARSVYAVQILVAKPEW